LLAVEPRPPNFVIILADDLGFQDLGCFGAADIATPHLDQMAFEGARFSCFLVPQAVCSASRAALMTGCYPNRIGIQGALGPRSKIGLHTNEITLAELLKTRGYATAIYGKWHLGDAPDFLPTRRGFDDYFGLPYSNDMWPGHPTAGKQYPPLPLMKGQRTIEFMPDQTQLTRWYAEHAVRFIEKNRSRPFFLYLAQTMPHVPLNVSGKFKGKSQRGRYGDVVMEIDWSVGQVLHALRKNGVDDRTLVIFTSDNGPWLSYGNHAGSAAPLRAGKATTFEGGVRVPCVMRWPGKIPAGTLCRELASTMDLFPTFARLAGADVPKDRVIDGRDIWPLMSNQPEARSPHEVFYYYWNQHLQAIRCGKWKLHFPHAYAQPNPPGSDGKPGQSQTLQLEKALFDLENDAGETRNLIDQYPGVARKLKALAEPARVDLGDSATNRKGQNTRPAGRITE
jgi:arylsulfatase A-like enzyme